MSLTNTNNSSAASDVVAILDSKLNQVFPTARPVKAIVNEISKPMEHPVETGVIITDHRIILPIEIEISFILKPADYRSVYQQIKLLYTNAPFLTVQTKAATYKNMIISAIPHEENVELYNAIPLILRLKQVQIVAPQSGTLPASSVKNPVNQSTVARGNQQINNAYMIEKVPAVNLTQPGFILPAIPTTSIPGSQLPSAEGIVIVTPNDKAPSPPPMTPDQFKQMWGAAQPQ